METLPSPSRNSQYCDLRGSQFPDVLHKSGRILFCTACNTVVEHERKWPLHRHFSTAKHAKKMAETGRGKTRQVPTTEAVGSRTVAGAERVKVSADILYKAIEEKNKDKQRHAFLSVFYEHLHDHKITYLKYIIYTKKPQNSQDNIIINGYKSVKYD
uniref:Uncharacterized protein n=1 Tax=Sphaeramia orbicularis TaxID=375764 RepID=A0A672ZXB2_9TELE